ncbi:MAG: DinB family protein [Mycobacterium leprae]
MHDMIQRYLAGPAKLRRSLEGLTAEELHFHPAPGKWSAHQIAIHVADMDLSAAFRMRRILAEPGSGYPGVDQDRWAVGLLYEERELEPSLFLLEALRREMTTVLIRVPESAWSQTGIHSEAGEQKLSAVLENYTGHLERHVEQIEAIKRKLGK